MIKNDRQYKISIKKVRELSEGILRLRNDDRICALKKELVSGSLIMAKDEIEQDILLYETKKRIRKEF